MNLQLLPTPVDPEEAEEMFDFADKDKDSKIGWEEFQVLHFCFYIYFNFQINFHKNMISKMRWEEFLVFHFHFSNWISWLLLFSPWWSW